MPVTLCATFPLEEIAHRAALRGQPSFHEHWRRRSDVAGTDADASVPIQLTIHIAPLAHNEVEEAAGVAAQIHQLNAAARTPSPIELRAWMARPHHHVLRVRAFDQYGDHGIVGLMLCHADEEDFVADGFMLKSDHAGLGIEEEMISALGRMALSSGCGAVVLTLIESATNRLAQMLFKGLGCGIETLASGVREVAFASLAVEDVLMRAKSFLSGMWLEAQAMVGGDDEQRSGVAG
ncbi:hypothetical protein WG922_17960 [Ramlibacter sp. AN1015]|uniref:hypothetical protein n=1 Tax=Ramlibacter sp. AN1015 TaxID=3133428 RepID=UPI0030BC7959